MIIGVDKNQFAGSHGKSNYDQHMQIRGYGAELLPLPLPFGDYCLVTDDVLDTIKRRGDKLKKADLVGDIKRSVDTKASLDEVAMNVQSSSHARFRDEVILSKKCGCHLFVLVEDDNVRNLNMVHEWRSKRKNSKVDPSSLEKAMKTMSEKYGFTWLFCKPGSTGRAILFILTGIDPENEQ